jgi:hypothetical protein
MHQLDVGEVTRARFCRPAPTGIATSPGAILRQQHDKLILAGKPNIVSDSMKCGSSMSNPTF